MGEIAVMPSTILIDRRSPKSVVDKVKNELAGAELYGFDIETQDRQRHAGLNAYNNANRHVFDHRRTVITGFSIYVQNSPYKYYFNMAHKDEENRLPEGFGVELLQSVNPDAIVVAHNAPFELVNVQQCWDFVLQNIVCTLQMAVSHHGPDEYDLDAFHRAGLPYSFNKFASDAISAFEQYSKGDALNPKQQELIAAFVAKESKASHSYNGFVDSIKIGYSLKVLTESRFGVKQLMFAELLKRHDASDMGDLTGEQTAEYGADDAYWAVKHYEWMLADMLQNNPKALVAFFETENPMVQVYAETWLEGIRLDLEQVFKRRDVERVDMAATLRSFKATVRKLLPFPTEPNATLLEKEEWYAKGWKAKRKQIEKWALSPDSEDNFEQVFQVSNPIGNAWATELGKAVPKSGKLNLVYYYGMRTLMYDLAGLPVQYDGGAVASDKDARGKVREKLTDPLLKGFMTDLQTMADIEQRVKLYLTPYTQLMDPETSRVYPSLSSQLATRRLATSFPNPMQLAKTGDSAYIRSFYLGDTNDDVVVSADWSAIELVLIGDQSGDEGFRKVYGQLPYGDMHTGAAVDGLSVKTLPGLTEEEFKEFKFGRNPNNRVLVDFGGTTLSPSDYYKWSRGTPVGKGINFSYWYSGALSTVAGNLQWSDKEHWEAVDKYRARFPQAEQWRLGVQDEAAIYGYVTLPDGHRRNRYEVTQDWAIAMRHKFADLSASPGLLKYCDVVTRRLQGRGRNQVVNALIQGSCATLAKRSVLNLRVAVAAAGLVWGKDVRLMMPIHDELVFSVKRWSVMTFIPLLREAMTNHPDIVKTLPLNCTVAIGRTFRPFNKADPRLSQSTLR